MDIGINGGKAAITFGQKITEHINGFIPFFNAVYEMLPDDTKKELDRRGITIDYIDKRVKTALAQIRN
jgi:hypothetical protein